MVNGHSQTRKLKTLSQNFENPNVWANFVFKVSWEREGICNSRQFKPEMYDGPGGSFLGQFSSVFTQFSFFDRSGFFLTIQFYVYTGQLCFFWQFSLVFWQICFGFLRSSVLCFYSSVFWQFSFGFLWSLVLYFDSLIFFDKSKGWSCLFSVERLSW